MERQIFWAVALLAYATGGIRPAQARPGPPKSFDRAEYGSPSGRYRLVVSPTKRFGEGAAYYRLMLDGTQVWYGKRAFTLHDAAVADDGAVAGYGYSHGVRAFGRFKGRGSFHVAVLAPDGITRQFESVPRVDGRYEDAPPDPRGRAVIIDPANDRVIVRVPGRDWSRHTEAWWVYELSTGRRLPRLSLRLDKSGDPVHQWLLDARPVAGTPLMLVHWWWYEGWDDCGNIYWLVDRSGRPVWRREQTLDKGRSSEGPIDHGEIVPTETEGAFTVRFAFQSRQMTYAVAPAVEGRWDVREIAVALAVRPVQRATPLPNVILRDEPGPPGRASLEGERLRTPDGGHWIVDSDRITLRDSHGKWVLEHRHRPDGKWLDWIQAASAGSAGMLAVVDRGRGVDNSSVSLYSPGGEPLTTFDLPFGRYTDPEIAITPNEVIVTAGSTGFVADHNGNNLRRFALPPGRDRGSVASEIHVSQDGRRLILSDGAGRSYRYRLPLLAQ